MTPTIIKPTIGRVVWFHPSELTGENNFARHGNDQPYAAIVAHVHSDSMVNLTVFDANGVPHSRTSVGLVQDGDPVPGHGYYCEWMPYQKGQAVKAEATPQMTLEPTRIDPREQLEYALVHGAAARLAEAPHEAAAIATGIKSVLDALHPLPVLFNPHTGTQRAPGDVASDPQAAPKKLAITDEMVGRFLSWPLPEDFAPDCGITFARSSHAGMGPTGTNLLHFGQAKAMLEHCINGLSASTVTLPVVDPGPDSLEREIQAKADKGPRVTPQALLDEIVSEHYHSPQQAGDQAWTGDANGALNTLTICVLVLRNGTKVVGINHGAIDPAQHSAERGRQEARAQAVDKVYELLGFRLRDELSGASSVAISNN